MRTPVLLYALALGIRLALVALFPDPAYTDSYYYVNAARALADGRGFNVDFVWIFAEVGGAIPANATLPIPSNAHWMPLASLVQVPFIGVLGPTPFASALPFALIGALAAPLTWAIARDASARPSVALGAGLLVAIPAMSLVYMPQPDNFSLYQPLVAGALWLGARGLRGNRRAFAFAGLLTGLATLSRNDGVLVGAALGLAWAWDRWRAWRSSGGRAPTLSVWSAVACLGLFLVVMGPWWLRQLATFGQLSPSTASGKVLFIRSIAEWNNISTPATLDHLLSQGLGPLLASRLGGLAAAIAIFATLIGGIFLAPFMVVGGWIRRRSVDFGPFFAYAALLFAFSAIVSAVHVPGGTFIHSAVALAPHAYILALEGVVAAIGFIATRRRLRHVDRARTVAIGWAVGFAALQAGLAAAAVQSAWMRERAESVEIDQALDDAGVPADARVMSIDAGQTKYYTGRGGVVLVNDRLDVIEAVAAAYDVGWLVIDEAAGVHAVDGIIQSDARPTWVGPAIYRVEPTPSSTTRLAIYPVCLRPAANACPATAADGG